jgi:hypothetical protein
MASFNYLNPQAAANSGVGYRNGEGVGVGKGGEEVGSPTHTSPESLPKGSVLGVQSSKILVVEGLELLPEIEQATWEEGTNILEPELVSGFVDLDQVQSEPAAIIVAVTSAGVALFFWRKPFCHRFLVYVN